MFEIASLSQTCSAPVFENWDCKKPKTRNLNENDSTILSGCLDFEGRSAAVLTYMVYSPKGFTTNENNPWA